MEFGLCDLLFKVDDSIFDSEQELQQRVSTWSIGSCCELSIDNFFGQCPVRGLDPEVNG